MNAGHFSFSNKDYWLFIVFGAIVLAGGVKNVRAREGVTWVRLGRVIRYSADEVVTQGWICILVGVALLILGVVNLI